MCYGVFSKSFSGALYYRLRNYVLPGDVQIPYQLTVKYPDLGESFTRSDHSPVIYQFLVIRRILYKKVY